jgi:hypothetical protein
MVRRFSGFLFRRATLTDRRIVESLPAGVVCLGVARWKCEAAPELDDLWE